MTAWNRQIRRAMARDKPGIAPTIAGYRSDRLTAHQAASTAARAQGCTCDPDIEIDGIHAYVRHDDWCALLRHGDVN
jgi:hypothetical protein